MRNCSAGFEHLADMVQEKKRRNLVTGAIEVLSLFVTPLSVACAGLLLLQ